jgi:hypothetical protein
MLLTTVRLYPPSGRNPVPAPGVVIDLLWLHAMPPDGVEYIHARAGPGRIDVAVFTIASDQLVADYVVARVCQRAIASVPVLSGWEIAAR